MKTKKIKTFLNILKLTAISSTFIIPFSFLSASNSFYQSQCNYKPLPREWSNKVSSQKLINSFLIKADESIYYDIELFEKSEFKETLPSQTFLNEKLKWTIHYNEKQLSNSEIKKYEKQYFADYEKTQTNINIDSLIEGYTLTTTIDFEKFKVIYQNLMLNNKISQSFKDNLQNNWENNLKTLIKGQKVTISLHNNQYKVLKYQKYIDIYADVFNYQEYWAWVDDEVIINDEKQINNVEIELEGEYTKSHENFTKLNTGWYEISNNIINRKKEFFITSDTGGDLNTPKTANFKSNKQYLDEYFNKLNTQIKAKQIDMQLVYKQTAENKINVYIVWNNETKLLIENLHIKFRPNSNFEGQSIDDRLKIQCGKWVDFDTNTTELVDDILIRDKNDKQPIGINNKTKIYWAGKWIAHTPLNIIFNTTKKENEVLKINGKRIEVLDQEFKEILQDKRINADDNERIFDYGVEADEDTPMTEENSHRKNEYKIEIFKYSKPGNLQADLEMHYTKVLYIDSKSAQIDFKWYAWDPENNPQQKELIEEFLKDANDNIIHDKNGKNIKNPKYDASIDKNTGTKKQLVWFNLNIYDNNPQLENLSDNFDIYYSTAAEKQYYKQTKLPYNSKTLFAPHNKNSLDKGFIAEAIVLGKGGLKQLIGQTEKFTLYKLEKKDNYLTFIKQDNQKFYQEEILKTSDNTYFSNSGIWLFASNAEKSISNFKLVLIKENSNPQSYFTENVILDSGQVKPLWKTKQGVQFYNYLKQVEILDDDYIFSLSYEEAMQYYKNYINHLYWNAKYNDFISIYPTFNRIKDDEYTTSEFTSKYLKNNYKAAYDEILSNFEHKALVKIVDIKISDDKQGIYLKLALNTWNDLYKLNKLHYLPIKFKDVPRLNKKTINLNLNYEYIQNLASENAVNNYLKLLNKHQHKLFKNPEEELNKLEITFSLNVQEKKLIIHTSLLNQYKNDYKIEPENDFLVQIHKFKEFNQDNINENDIFAGIKINDINLLGLNDYESIKTFILNELQNNLNNLELDKDYEIKNLDDVINERLSPQINVFDLDYVQKSILVLEAKNGNNGVLYVNVINTANKLFADEINLANIKIKDLVINEANINTLKSRVTEYIKTELAKYNIDLGLDARIINFNEGIFYLCKGKSYSFDFIIEGINKKIINTTKVNITNEAQFVVDEHNNLILYDLSIIQKQKFKYNENVLSVLRNKIIKSISDYIYTKYKLKLNEDYTLNLKELDNLVRNISIDQNIELEDILFIYPIDNVSKNKTSFYITNITDKKIIDDLDEVKPSLPSLPKDEEELKKAKKIKKLLMTILIPAGVGILFIGGIIIWFIKIRYFNRRIK